MNYTAIAIILLLFTSVYFITRHFRHRQAARSKQPPSMDTQNTTNYNIAIPKISDTETLDPKDAQIIMKKWEASDYIPTEAEYNKVKQAMKNG